ncbi:MAG TPA: type II toxin-antitoxin system VapC family toxin [Acetobacteraceae bacterium]|jgi:PIN domain nuclease of toxin-antitoxin system|nr:type II toxin-antitoxin system VapC family toxin [Acetobacteraceae bacterium]
MSREPARRRSRASASARTSLVPRSGRVSVSASHIAGYIADACALITYFALPDPYGTMPSAAPILRSQPVRVSPITIWEITRKVAIGKLASMWTPYPSLSQLLHAQMFTIQPFGWDEAEAANQLPHHHRDPMDRILIATALMHNLAILTDDRLFAPYGVKTVW